jgi:hypothetical protein
MQALLWVSEFRLPRVTEVNLVPIFDRQSRDPCEF